MITIKSWNIGLLSKIRNKTFEFTVYSQFFLYTKPENTSLDTKQPNKRLNLKKLVADMIGNSKK